MFWYAGRINSTAGLTLLEKAMQETYQTTKIFSVKRAVGLRSHIHRGYFCLWHTYCTLEAD